MIVSNFKKKMVKWILQKYFLYFMSQKAVIMGMGRIGCAMKYLMNKQVEVECYDTNPGRVEEQKSLQEIIPEADVVFVCVPSWVLRTCLEEIRPLLSSKTILISLCKGIEQETHKTMELVIEESLPSGQAFGVLIGPMMAEELIKDLGGVGVVGSSQKNVFEILRAMISPSLRLLFSQDVHGVALAGVLKNVYALGMGILDALQWGQNRKGWFVCQSVKEMIFLTRKLGGKEETILGPAGLGDFIATGFSQYSNNRSVGETLVKEGLCKKDSGGKVSIESLEVLVEEYLCDLPILSALNQIVNKQSSAKEEYENLFTQIR